MDNLQPTTRQHYEDALGQLRKDVEKQGAMITLLQGWLGIYRQGYSALQSYGIDFMSFKVYEKEYPHAAEKLPLVEGCAKYVKWFGRIESGIAAAIRRKQWTVTNGNPSGE